jgi:adrenodoxin-NADP+ reductase
MSIFLRSVSRSSQIASLRFFSSWKVAIVGSGPSGCYAAKYLNSSSSKLNNNVKIDILERLPTAYGLVRNGVAPDHPEVKNVQHDFDSLINGNGNIDFHGNVRVGTDVSLRELRQLYDVVVLAYGCESDRSLSIPNAQNLEGILSAREFVNWYNGHVDFEWVGPKVQKALNRRTTSPNQNNNSSNDIVVIGHGNVALDCARILAKTRDELDPTDIATRALDIVAPADSQQPRNISIVGRRGHVQGAFTIKEVRELTKLPHAEFSVRPDELELGLSTEASQQELKDSRPKTRINKLLTEAATKSVSSDHPTTQVHLRFLMNPIRFESDDGSTLSRVVCERTQLIGESGKQAAKGTGEEESLDAQLVRASEAFFETCVCVYLSIYLDHS